MNAWTDMLTEMVSSHGAAVRVCVISAEGSTPREVGASMIVGADTFSGTIGGGVLEHEAMASARAMLDNYTSDWHPSDWQREIRSYPLGPSLGQCCGGSIRLLFELVGKTEIAIFDDPAILMVHPLETGSPSVPIYARDQRGDDWPLALSRAIHDMLSGAAPRQPCVITGITNQTDWFIEPVVQVKTPLYLYGAGHVGRAVIKTLSALPFDITWIDTGPERFPADVSSEITQVVAAKPAIIAKHAPAGAYHVVMTYSHPLDLDICHAVLSGEGFAYLGVIGSKTKRTRFVRRLSELDISDHAIGAMICPIGLPGLAGKEPGIIAVSLVADLLLRLSQASETSRLTGNMERT